MTRRGFDLGRRCSTCGTGIYDKSASGLCKRCCLRRAMADPETNARRIAKMKAAVSTPEARARLSTNAKIAARKRYADPEARERAARHMREVVQPLTCTPEAVARRDSAERGRKRTATVLAWCPPEYRDLYRHLLRQRGIRKADAKQIVMRQVSADEARLSPFERQERALARGAKLVANDRGPSFGEAIDYGEAKWEVGRVA